MAGAIADPVRREILLMLRDEPLSAGQIADRFVISRPAVSRHLRVLREAGLVEVRQTGRERLYRLNAAPLRDVYAWAAHYEAFWHEKLDALAQYLEENE